MVTWFSDQNVRQIAVHVYAVRGYIQNSYCLFTFTRDEAAVDPVSLVAGSAGALALTFQASQKILRFSRQILFFSTFSYHV